jgi:5-methylcytosine-specific restriction enzyme subunit McrC
MIGPAGKVGAARVGEVEIHILPKLSIARLMFMAGYAMRRAAWRDEDIGLSQADDLIPALAHALWRQVARAIHQGLLPGYIVLKEASPVLRGRLRETEQLHRHHGLPFPLEIVLSQEFGRVVLRRKRRISGERSGVSHDDVRSATRPPLIVRFRHAA